MGCGLGMIKYLLFIFNFIFAICGLGILTVGIIVHLQITHFSETLEANLVFPSVTLIVIGSIIFIISFFGCCGAIRESHCMTITFASFLLTILIIQVAVAVYAFVVLKNADSEDINIPENYRKFFNGYWSDSGNRELIDALQSSFQCCGVDSPNDFKRADFNGTIPWSCCGNPEGTACAASDKIYESGCAIKIKDVLTQAGAVLGGVALGIAGVELVGIIFALCLANSIKNTERRGYRV